MLLCSPIEYQVALTFSRHLNYKYVPASDQLQGYLINNQLMVASQTRQYQRPSSYISGKKPLLTASTSMILV